MRKLCLCLVSLLLIGNSFADSSKINFRIKGVLKNAKGKALNGARVVIKYTYTYKTAYGLKRGQFLGHHVTNQIGEIKSEQSNQILGKENDILNIRDLNNSLKINAMIVRLSNPSAHKKRKQEKELSGIFLVPGKEVVSSPRGYACLDESDNNCTDKYPTFAVDINKTVDFRINKNK